MKFEPMPIDVLSNRELTDCTRTVP